MADEQSIQLLAFNFGSRTFAYLRLAQGLNRSLSAFNTTIRKYLDALVKADKCAQYVDVIGIAANNVDELIINIEAGFPTDTEGRTKAVNVQMRIWPPEDRVLG